MSDLSTAAFDKSWPKKYALRPKVRERLAKEFMTPEGEVRAKWVLKLIDEYGFSPDQIDVNVPAGAGRNAEKSTVTADIVAYRDHARKEPFITVETKRPDELSGVKQAESYSRNLGAEYHVWSNGISTRFFRTAKYVDQSEAVGNVPRWVGNDPVAGKLPKSVLLPPFRDEPHLRQVVKVCHDRIFFQLGHDPAKSFDELMKLLFLKLFDERETPNVYEFMIVAGETERETAKRIRELFGRSIKSLKYRDVFKTKFNQASPTLDLDDTTIAFIVRHFQGFSLVNTTATLEGADVKGTVFEKMVGSTFRGELGAYFTPREIVEFMVSMLEPTRDDVVLDPSCGSGGFLIMVLKQVVAAIREENPNLTLADIYDQLKEYAKNNVFGVDINERMARVTKMNMIMHGDGHGGIHQEHGLNLGTTAELEVGQGEFTLVLSNPPFAGREAAEEHLAKFEVAVSETGKRVSVHKTLPFVELITQLLKPDAGRAGLVLPSGIFNSRSYHFAKLREIIWATCEVRAIIGLPHWVFFHTGCDVQGALLFIERKSKPQNDYPIFVDWADHVGYDAIGKKTGKNDLPDIMARFRKLPNDHIVMASEMKAKGRMDPLYFRPGGAAGKLKKAAESGTAVPLTSLVTQTTEFIKRGKTNERMVSYIEVGDTDKQTGQILTPHEYKVKDLPSRARHILRENILLIPNHRNSIKAGRSVVLVPAEADGWVATSRFISVICRVPALYLYYILNLPFVKEAMLRLVSGSSSSEVKFDQLSEIMVPMPPGGDFDALIDDIVRAQEEIAELESQLAESRGRMRESLSQLYDA